MTNFQPGDVVLVEYPFVERGQGKRQPALVLCDTGDDDALLARITTHDHGTPFDVRITDWRGAGLNAPSIARLH